MNRINENSRDPYFDNLKGFLILLVFLGHLLCLFNANQIINCAYEVIYTFHMPLFIFISGYFSKKKKGILELFKVLIVPTILFEILSFMAHAITGVGESNYPFMTPIFTYWYIWAIFIYRVLLPIFEKIRFLIPVSFIVAIGVGFNPLIGEYFTLSRLFCFLPFFLIGYYCDDCMLKKIRKTNSLFFLINILFVAIIMYLLLCLHIDHDFSYSSSYANPTGAIGRFSGFVIAFLISLVVIRFIPNDKNIILTKIGLSSNIIYYLHFYIVSVVGLFSSHINSVPIEILMCVTVALSCSLFLSLDFIKNIIDKIVGCVNKIIFKD